MMIMIVTQGLVSPPLESNLIFQNKSISPLQVLRRTNVKAPEKVRLLDPTDRTVRNG